MSPTHSPGCIACHRRRCRPLLPRTGHSTPDRGHVGPARSRRCRPCAPSQACPVRAGGAAAPSRPAGERRSSRRVQPPPPRDGGRPGAPPAGPRGDNDRQELDAGGGPPGSGAADAAARPDRDLVLDPRCRPARWRCGAGHRRCASLGDGRAAPPWAPEAGGRSPPPDHLPRGRGAA